MKRLLIIFTLIASVCAGQVTGYGPYDPGAPHSQSDILGMAGVQRWGIRISATTADPYARVTYLYDAVGKTPASMNFTTGVFDYGGWQDFCEWICRPVMLTYDGLVDYELSHSDHSKKIDGTTGSDVANTAYDGNAMVEFKRLWVSMKTLANGDLEIVYSTFPYNSDFKAYAFTNAAGVVQEHMYYAMYEGSYDGAKLRSLAVGVVMVDETGQNEISRAQANGAGWDINYKSQRDFITGLHWLIGKSTNDQAVFGNGNSDSAAYIAPGSLIDKGGFCGYNTTAQAIKTFYVENYWGNYWKRQSGLLMALNGEMLTRMTPPYLQPALPSQNVVPPGYTFTGRFCSGTSGQHMKTMVCDNASGFLPVDTINTENVYYSCGLWWTVGTTVKWSLVSGNRDNGSRCGCATVNLYAPLSHAATSIGAALSFLKSPS